MTTIKDTDKAVIWGRVSTVYQELETQVDEMIDKAVDDGYKRENLIVIKGKGASARKQNELYKQEVEELLNTLMEDSAVNCVYVWEVSRLARAELPFFRMKDYIVTHKIQLIVKTPSIKLFDDDGTLNLGQEVILNLLVTLAKQEMEIKEKRFARGKARNKAEGKYNGGRIKLGYMLDETKHFVRNPNTDYLVERIFSAYINSEKSVDGIYRELVDLGIYHPKPNVTNGNKQMNAILKDRAYIGENGYPRIIDDESFEAAQAKMATHPKRHKAKDIYFCHSILKDAETGYTLIADRGAVLYAMNLVRPRYFLSMNACDMVCWFTASFLYNSFLGDQNQINREEYATRIKENETKIDSLNAHLEEYQKLIDRAINMNLYRPEHYSTEKMDADISSAEKKIQRTKDEITSLRLDNTRMQQFLDGKEKPTYINFNQDYSDSMRKEIIDTVIEKILVTKTGERQYKLQVINKIGYLDNSYWLYDSTKSKVKLYMVDARGARADFTDYIVEKARFKRKRYDRKKK